LYQNLILIILKNFAVIGREDGNIQAIKIFIYVCTYKIYDEPVSFSFNQQKNSIKVSFILRSPPRDVATDYLTMFLDKRKIEQGNSNCRKKEKNGYQNGKIKRKTEGDEKECISLGNYCVPFLPLLRHVSLNVPSQRFQVALNFLSIFSRAFLCT